MIRDMKTSLDISVNFNDVLASYGLHTSQSPLHQKENASEYKVLKESTKTINSRYSLVVTHPTTNRPAHGLSITERTGSPVFHVLWSIAV
jgi:hypothetical protein